MTRTAAASGSPRLSIVLPVYNEEAVLAQTYQRLVDNAAVLEADGFQVTWIFVNDGSADQTPTLLDELAGQDARVRVLHLTRNFGHQAAITAGLNDADGDVVAIMDADLQDPPEELPRFLEAWRDGYQVIYAVREKRDDVWLKRLMAWLFYRCLRSISELKIPADAGDFCLLDRSAVDLLNALPERQRYVRGLRVWVGLKQIGLKFERAGRAAGKSNYTPKALIKLAMDGFVSFSTIPLRLVTRLGLLGVLAAMAIGVWAVSATIYSWVTGQPTPRGWASLACLILGMGSIQLLSLGIIGEYLARIFLEVKQRPTYLIARVTDGSDAKASDGGKGRDAS